MTRVKSAPVPLLTLLAALGTIAAVAACDDSPTRADGSCVAVVNVHGVFFGSNGPPAVDPETVSSEAFLTVTRSTECLDQGETSDPLAHGESNFLPVGTTLHAIEGYGPEERLAVWSGLVAEWRVLAPVPTN